jgi:hypothetical protein
MAVADALQVVQYDQVSRTPLSVQTIDERQISEELRGNPLRPRTLSTLLSGSPACSEVRAYGGLMTTASMEGGRRSWPILGHRTIWRRRTFLFPNPFRNLKAPAQILRPISTPPASRSIMTAGTHVKKVPGKGSRMRYPRELTRTSPTSFSTIYRLVLVGCLTISLGQNL